MAYPESSDVASAMPTASAHYNNLRKDALYLGMTSANAAALGALLQRYESNVNLQYLATNRVRCVGSAVAPVCLVINGYMLVSTANVDLGTAPSGAAGTWYIFANRTAGSTTFTLTANTSITEGTDQRRIGSCYWNGSATIRDSIQIEREDWLSAALKYLPTPVCQGRLTLNTGEPVPTADTSGGTVYFTPFKGNTIHLYVDNIGWVPYNFSEISISVSGVASGTNCDIFAYDNAGVVTLERVSWTNITTRATALALQDGIYVKSGDTSRRYLGTVRLSATSTVTDGALYRGVWNYYNRVPRRMWVYDDTSHTYGTATVRMWDDNAANELYFVVGVVEDTFFAEVLSNMFAGAAVSIGVSLYLNGYTSAERFTYISTTVPTNLGTYSTSVQVLPRAGGNIVAIQELPSGATACTLNWVDATVVVWG